MGAVGADEGQRTEAEELVRVVRMACHGLRNPLAIATGMLDLLERLAGEQLDEESHELLTRSSAAVHRTADMVSRLQRYVSGQHRPLHPVPVDLGEAVSLVAEPLDPAELAVQVTGPLPTLLADLDMVEWVVDELVQNARVHAGDERPVTVAVGAVDGDGRSVVSFTDDGPGIPPDRFEDAFAAGERLDRVGGGLGLGLPMVRTVLRRHGGDAWLEPNPAGPGLRAVTAWPASPAT